MSDSPQQILKTYTLYHDFPSLCSLMVRFTWALRSRESEKAVIELHRINIMEEEQLAENFLVKIHWKGQVPVLVPNDPPSTPLPESQAITNFIVDMHPELRGPARYQHEIRELIHELHKINYFAISFQNKPRVTYGFQENMHRRLEAPDVSEAYRMALRRKLSLWQEENINPMEKPNLAQNEAFTKDLMLRLAAVWETKGSGPGSWLYGAQPTALDAHLTVFLARLRDVGRLDLAPPSLVTYLDWVCLERPEWKEMMGDLDTMPRSE